MNRDCLEQYPDNQSRIWPLLLLFILMQVKAALLIFTACSHDDQRGTRRDTWHPPFRRIASNPAEAGPHAILRVLRFLR